MSNILMHKARYTAPDDTQTVIILPGKPVLAGESRYEQDIHKGHLSCLFCDAAVHFHRGSSIIAGQNHLRGAAPHFHTNPGQIHEDKCQWSRPEQEKSFAQYDKEAGFRLHLNAHGFAGGFNTAANPLYRRDADNRLVVTEERARRMEPKSIYSVTDLIDFLRLKDPLRINSSRIIMNEYDIPWPDFMLRYSANPKIPDGRFMDMVDRLSASYRKRQPVLMEMDVKRPVYPRDAYSHIPPVLSKSILWRRDAGKAAQIIRPAVHLKNKYDTRVSCAFASAGKYLVLGMARLYSTEEQSGLVHYLNIDVTDHRQISKISLAEIAAENRSRFPR